MNDGKLLACHWAFKHLNHPILWEKTGQSKKTTRLDSLNVKQRKAEGFTEE